jgi:hypothetical protein
MRSAPDPRGHLAAADRHVAEAEGRVARQAETVARSRAEGRDTAEAEAVLRAFRLSLELLREHRERLSREIADEVGGGGPGSSRSPPGLLRPSSHGAGIGPDEA